MKRSLTYAALAAALLSSACTTTKLVPVPCLSPAQLKQLEDAEPPKVGGSLTGRADQDLRIVSGSALRLRAWGRGNLDVLRGCAN